MNKLPRAIPIAEPVQKKPVVIEQTSKRYKLAQLVGGLMIAFGMFATAATQTMSPINGVAIAAGLAIYLCGRILGWWHHG
jgi:predicted benzoate:H+ symporter BenE